MMKEIKAEMASLSAKNQAAIAREVAVLMMLTCQGYVIDMKEFERTSKMPNGELIIKYYIAQLTEFEK